MNSAARLFDDFRAHAVEIGAYPLTLTQADNLYRKETDRWVRTNIISRVSLDPATTEGFDRAWLIRPYARSKSRVEGSKAKSHSSVIIAVNRQTGQLRILFTGVSNSMLQKHNIHELIRMMLTSTYDFPKQKEVPVRYGEDLTDVEEFIETALSRNSKVFLNQISKVNRRIRVKYKEATNMRLSAAEILIPEVQRNFASALEEAASYTDFDDFNFVRHIKSQSSANPLPSVISIFNLIRAGTTPQTRDYRKGALTVLAPLGHLFIKVQEKWHRDRSPLAVHLGNAFFNDKVFWDHIDAGQSVYSALAEQTGTSKAQVRHAIRHAQIFAGQSSLVFLDDYKKLCLIDTSLWPQTADEMTCFRMAVDLAKHYVTAFPRSFEDTFKDFAKQFRAMNCSSWTEYMGHKLKTEIADFIVQPEAERDHKETEPDKIMKRALQKAKNNISNIKHMKDDINQRLTLPAIILEMERLGFDVLRTDALDPLITGISRKIWHGISPSEQIAASAFWHSPRVNFLNRLQSIALTDTSGISWQGLSSAPISAAGKVTLIPLNSDPALRDEGRAMSHCVGGYAVHCLKNNYHIFSVRDDKGNRLSTLTVQDRIDNRQRVITHVEHRGFKNHAPPELARQAEEWLIKTVNEGDFKPDWKKIDTSKAEFLQKEVDLTVGYDFRAEGQRQRIFDLYQTILPGNRLRIAERAVITFFEQFDLSGMVEEFLAGEFEYVGIMKRTSLPSAPPTLMAPNL